MADREDEAERRLSAALRAHAAVPVRPSGGGTDGLVSVWTVLAVALAIGLLAGALAGIISAV